MTTVETMAYERGDAAIRCFWYLDTVQLGQYASGGVIIVCGSGT